MKLPAEYARHGGSEPAELDEQLNDQLSKRVPDNAAHPFSDQLSKIARASALLRDSAQRLQRLEEALQAAETENFHLRDQLQDALDRAQQFEMLLEDAEKRSSALENSLAATQADLKAVTEAIEASLPDIALTAPQRQAAYGR